MARKGIRMNKTQGNLETVWKQLDNASSELHNALDNLSRMVDLPETIKRQVDMMDVSRVDMLRNEIEDLIEDKESLYV